MRRFFSLVLMMSLFTQGLSGQKPASSPSTAALAKPALSAKDSSIVKLFSNPADIKWIKTFKGRMNEAAMVDLVLGSDGTTAKGYLGYPKAKFRLRVEGKFDSTGVKLEEREATGKTVTGQITGTYSNRKVLLEWVSVDKSIGNRIDAVELSPGQSVVMNCSDNKWSTRYLTRYSNARCDMVLLRGQNGSLDGFLWVEADAKTYKLKGEIFSDGNYEIEALASNGKLAAMLQGNLKAGQNMDCNWVGSGEKRQFKFIVKDHFQTGCYEYADFSSQYDVLYPRTPCPSCNTWMDEQVNAWVTKCKAKLGGNKMPLTPENRNRQRAAAWSEVMTWTDIVFSGYVTFTDTWTDQAQGFSYNFNLKAGKLISYDDLFNKTFNVKQWLDDYVKKEMPKIPAFAADPKFREWLNQAGMPMFTLRREGLELSSYFHPQYGRQTLTIPYEQLKPYMKKDNPAAEFVK
jgi:hypothetical protein